MKEVAAAAAVSTSTVCRALGADPRIPEATRQRIHEIATSLGYRPDPLLSAYARQRRGKAEGSEIATLAYVTNFPTADGWMRNTFYAPLFEGARVQAERHGFRLEHFWAGGPGMTGRRLSRILYNRGIVGLCIAPTAGAGDELDLEWERFSCATIAYSLMRPQLHRVAPHHFHAVLTGARELRALGYTRIGLCLFADTNRRADDLWLAGAMLSHRLQPDAPVFDFLFTDETLTGIADWVRENRIEAVLSDNRDALCELRRHGARVPEDIGYATLNWTATDPVIAGIDQRPECIGAAASDLIIAQIRRGERGVPSIPITSLVESVWVPGPSVCATNCTTAPLSVAGPEAASAMRSSKSAAS